METTIEYLRIRHTEPIISSGPSMELDWFHAYWHLVPAEALYNHKRIKPKSIQWLNGFVTLGQPLRFMNVELTLLEGVLAQVALTIATPPNRSPVIEPWIITSVLGQIRDHELFQRPCLKDQEPIDQQMVQKQIKDFITPITKHTKHYPSLGKLGRKVIKHNVDALV